MVIIMKIIDLLSIILTALTGAFILFFPDFPLSQETFIALITWIMGRFGYKILTSRT